MAKKRFHITVSAPTTIRYEVQAHTEEEARALAMEWAMGSGTFQQNSNPKIIEVVTEELKES